MKQPLSITKKKNLDKRNKKRHGRLNAKTVIAIPQEVVVEGIEAAGEMTVNNNVGQDAMIVKTRLESTLAKVLLNSLVQRHRRQ